MAVTDLADDAAVVAAGYTKTLVDKGVSFVSFPRYRTLYSKVLATVAGAERGVPDKLEAIGTSDVDAATATTNAVAALNAERRHRYGGSPGRASGDAQSPDARGITHTPETN